MSTAASVSILSFRHDMARSMPSFCLATTQKSLATSRVNRHAAATFGLRWQPWVLQTSSRGTVAGRIHASTSVRSSSHSRNADCGCESPKAVASSANVNMGDNALNKFESKWLIFIIFAIRILWKHDIESLWAGIGAPINYYLSTGLKHVFKQQRPIHANKSDPGMPSSHSQSFFYVSSYLILSLILWRGVNILTISTGAFIMIISSYLSSLRVSKQFHTRPQVVVGAIFGSAYAALWLWSWDAFAQAALESSVWLRALLLLANVIYHVLFVADMIRTLSRRSLTGS